MSCVDLLGVPRSFDGSGGVLLSVLYFLQDLEGSGFLFDGGDLLLNLLQHGRTGICDDVGRPAIGGGRSKRLGTNWTLLGLSKTWL